MRKTVNVQDLKMVVNSILANHHGDGPGDARYRAGMMDILEHVLHETGNYRGFQYLNKDQVPVGNKPGINTDDHGSPLNDYGLRFADTDDTRVVYG